MVQIRVILSRGEQLSLQQLFPQTKGKKILIQISLAHRLESIVVCATLVQPYINFGTNAKQHLILFRKKVFCLVIGIVNAQSLSGLCNTDLTLSDLMGLDSECDF